MTTKVYPSLSEDAWVTSPDKITDYIFSCFLVSDYSQTYLFKDKISSLPYILQQTQGNVTEAVIATQNTLSTYFSRYFNNVVVEVNEVPNETEPSKAQISLYVRFKDDQGKEHNLAKLLQINETIIEKIVTINNG